MSAGLVPLRLDRLPPRATVARALGERVAVYMTSRLEVGEIPVRISSRQAAELLGWDPVEHGAEANRALRALKEFRVLRVVRGVVDAHGTRHWEPYDYNLADLKRDRRPMNETDSPSPRTHPLEKIMTGDDPVAILVQSLERVLAGDFGLPEDGCFGWAPLPLDDFFEGMAKASEILADIKDRPLKFLDVGCGIGSKVLLASQLGFEAYGFDRDEEYIRKARLLLGRRGKVWVGDARTYGDGGSLGGYADFDVVLMFHPLADEKSQAKLNAHVASEMAPHALFFCPGAMFPAGTTQIGPALWR